MNAADFFTSTSVAYSLLLIVAILFAGVVLLTSKKK